MCKQRLVRALPKDERSAVHSAACTALPALASKEPTHLPQLTLCGYCSICMHTRPAFEALLTTDPDRDAKL